jgi:hypothetical protein
MWNEYGICLIKRDVAGVSRAEPIHGVNIGIAISSSL